MGYDARTPNPCCAPLASQATLSVFFGWIEIFVEPNLSMSSFRSTVIFVAYFLPCQVLDARQSCAELSKTALRYADEALRWFAAPTGFPNSLEASKVVLRFFRFLGSTKTSFVTTIFVQSSFWMSNFCSIVNYVARENCDRSHRAARRLPWLLVKFSIHRKLWWLGVHVLDGWLLLRQFLA